MTTRTDVGTVEDCTLGDEACGLDEFRHDDDNYREALGVCSSRMRGRRSHRVGSKMQRFFVRNAWWPGWCPRRRFKQYPQHADVSIERPIFVTGLPRTGTTALHGC
jgi:hypothetical protein